MIDQDVFKKAWTLLCERFNREPSQVLMSAYYGTLSEQMDTEQFRRAAHQVFVEREFFPRPVDFLNAAQPDPRADALDQWEQCQKLMRGDPVKLTDEGKRVVQLLGGERQLKETKLDAVPFVRKEFLQLYGEAAAIAQRESRQQISASPEARRLTDTVHLKALP